MFKENVRIYKVILILSALGLIYWQFELSASENRSLQKGQVSSEMSFVMNTGTKVSVPSDLNKYSVVIFWRVASQASLKQLDEIIKAPRSNEIDTTFNFYFVNVSDSLDVIRSAVDFENTSIPFARNPSGAFLQRYDLRVFPYIIVLSADGTVMEYVEGYHEGQLNEVLQGILARIKAFGPSGTFKF